MVLQEGAVKKNNLLKYVPYILIAAGLVIAVLLVLWLKSWVESNDAPVQRKVQQFTVITPPPPPPIPEEEPPEPEVEEEIEQVDEEVVEEMPDETAEPTADLGIDADGAAGSDGFGLIGRKGGRGLLDGSPFAYYEGLMVSEIQDLLSANEILKSEEYRIRIKITVLFDGTIESIKLVRSTGNEQKDKILISLLKGFKRFSKMPPGKMPPIIDLRITSSI